MEEPHSHPAFPKPEDLSVNLWRYIEVAKLEWLVNCGRLFMPSADRLGDPFEGTTPSGELEWWRREAANADNDDHRRIIKHNREFLSRMAQSFRSHYYVSCWHMNQHENHAMWDCYTRQPESVAIRTTYGALRGCLPDYVEMGMVRYIDYATERLPTMNMFEYIMHKDSYYSFEREVRAVAFPPVVDELGGAHFRENHFESESKAGFLVYAPTVDLVQVIQGIILHPEASPAFETTMTDLCSKKGLPRPQASRRTRRPIF